MAGLRAKLWQLGAVAVEQMVWQVAGEKAGEVAHLMAFGCFSAAFKPHLRQFFQLFGG